MLFSGMSCKVLLLVGLISCVLLMIHGDSSSPNATEESSSNTIIPLNASVPSNATFASNSSLPSNVSAPSNTTDPPEALPIIPSENITLSNTTLLKSPLLHIKCNCDKAQQKIKEEMERKVKEEKGGIDEPAKNMTTPTQRTEKLEQKVVSAPPPSYPAKMEVTKPSTKVPTPYQVTEKQEEKNVTEPAAMIHAPSFPQQQKIEKLPQKSAPTQLTKGLKRKRAGQKSTKTPSHTKKKVAVTKAAKQKKKLEKEKVTEQTTENVAPFQISEKQEKEKHVTERPKKISASSQQKMEKGKEITDPSKELPALFQIGQAVKPKKSKKAMAKEILTSSQKKKELKKEKEVTEPTRETSPPIRIPEKPDKEKITKPAKKVKTSSKTKKRLKKEKQLTKPSKGLPTSHQITKKKKRKKDSSPVLKIPTSQEEMEMIKTATEAIPSHFTKKSKREREKVTKPGRKTLTASQQTK